MFVLNDLNYDIPVLGKVEIALIQIVDDYDTWNVIAYIETPHTTL